MRKNQKVIDLIRREQIHDYCHFGFGRLLADATIYKLSPHQVSMRLKGRLKEIEEEGYSPSAYREDITKILKRLIKAIDKIQEEKKQKPKQIKLIQAQLEKQKRKSIKELKKALKLKKEDNIISLESYKEKEEK